MNFPLAISSEFNGMFNVFSRGPHSIYVVCATRVKLDAVDYIEYVESYSGGIFAGQYALYYYNFHRHEYRLIDKRVHHTGRKRGK